MVVVWTDSAGVTLSDTDPVAITVTAVNDAPVNTVPGAQTVDEDTALAFTGLKTISLPDVGRRLRNVTGVQTCALPILDLTGGATISAGTNGTATLTLAGTEAQINAALATLSYQ